MDPHYIRLLVASVLVMLLLALCGSIDLSTTRVTLLQQTRPRPHVPPAASPFVVQDGECVNTWMNFHGAGCQCLLDPGKEARDCGAFLHGPFVAATFTHHDVPMCHVLTTATTLDDPCPCRTPPDGAHGYDGFGQSHAAVTYTGLQTEFQATCVVRKDHYTPFALKTFEGKCMDHFVRGHGGGCTCARRDTCHALLDDRLWVAATQVATNDTYTCHVYTRTATVPSACPCVDGKRFEGYVFEYGDTPIKNHMYTYTGTGDDGTCLVTQHRTDESVPELSWDMTRRGT